ncbi:MAG: hypothetical protein A2X48_19585 [Lentisphaerae bacterium GWF2_49_21]|nr:MAG: hypothetical protein A2X48_19585 [Lentisphaerae bacterium GWF2_49_21]
MKPDSNLIIFVSAGGLSVFILSFWLIRAYLMKTSSEFRDFEPEKSKSITLFKEILSPLSAFVISRQNTGSFVSSGLAEYRKQFTTAGGFYGLSVYEVYSLKFVIPFIFSILAFLLSVMFSIEADLAALVIILFSALLFYYPDSMLKSKAEARRKLFMKELPGGLDILKIAADAGLDFHSSVNYLVSIYIPGPLKEEMKIFQRELRLGISTMDALVNISSRMNISEASTVFVSLAQSIEMGTSISQMLGETITDMRKKRLLSAETEAQKTVIKITFPLLLLILPGIFIVLFAPIIKPMMNAFAGF